MNVPSRGMILQFLVVSYVLLQFPCGVQGQPLERKDIEDLIANDPNELKLYMEAVENIMRSGEYVSLANLHNIHTPAPACDAGCEHWNDLFLPWHRSLLFEFEQALQASDPPRTSQVTIPYWNWTQAHSGVRYPSEFERTGSVLCDKVVISTIGWNKFHDRRNRSGTSPPFSPQTLTNTINGNSTWLDFGGADKTDPCFRSLGGEWEDPYHDHMHSTYISGDMRTTGRAARDPIFWSFHCYVDKAWDRWQKKYPNAPISSLDDTLRGMTLKTRVRDVLDVEELNYFYTQPTRGGGSAGLAASEGGEREMNERILTMQLVQPRGARANVERNLESRRIITFSFELPDGEFSSAHARFVDVKVPRLMSYTGDLFLYPESEELLPNDKVFRAKYLNERPFTMWGGHDHEQQHTGDVQRTVKVTRITDLVRSVTAPNPGAKYLLTLVLKPVTPENPQTLERHAAATSILEEADIRSARLVLDRQNP